MRVFKNAWISKFTNKNDISDRDLLEAVERANKGLIDADLGGGVIKQRIARQGQGKRSGYRSLILFKQGDKAFFVYAFAKNDRENITEAELQGLKKLALDTLKLTDDEIQILLNQNVYVEL